MGKYNTAVQSCLLVFAKSDAGEKRAHARAQRHTRSRREHSREGGWIGGDGRGLEAKLQM